MKTKSGKLLRKKIKLMKPESVSVVIRNGKHVTLDLGYEKLSPDFKTSGDGFIMHP